MIAKQLSAYVLLGTTFIDEHVNNVWVGRRTVVLTDHITKADRMSVQ